MDNSSVEAAVIEDNITLLNGILGDGFHGDHVTVFDGGAHAAPAHSKLDRQVAGQ